MTRSQGSQQPKVLIIGLDGATFDLIKPWAAAGKLPTFSRLLNEGVHGDLTSTIPPVTAPAWTSFMTGKNPGKHGLYNFVEPQPRSYEIRYTNARSCLAKTLWQILNEAGMSVGVINVPMTYPPEPVNGYMISGRDAPGSSTAITYPRELYQELDETFGKVSPQLHYLGYLNTDQRRDALLQSLEEFDEHYLRMTASLMQKRPTDVAMVVFTSTDTVQHFFWHYLDVHHPQYDHTGADKYGGAILRIYQKADDIIGRLIAHLPKETAVVLLSDHGFRSTSARVIHLNRYLVELGLLTLRQARQHWYHPQTLIHHVTTRLDTILRSTLTPHQKARIARWFPQLRDKWESHYSGLSSIDWACTKAYSCEVLTFPPSIWINLKGLRLQGTVNPGKEYERVVQFTIDKLYDLKDPATGEPLIGRVYRKEEIYHGPYLDQAPDLTLECWEGKTFLGKSSFGQNSHAPVVAYTGGTPIPGGEWSGTHSLKGILVLHGKPFQAKKTLQRVDIIDLAPTLLYLLGLPIPDDMDGRIVLEAFTEEFAAVHSVSMQAIEKGVHRDTISDRTYMEDEAVHVEERLRDLGYIE